MTAAERAAEVIEGAIRRAEDNAATSADEMAAYVRKDLMADTDLLREMADETDPESAAHDGATFVACLVLADVVRRFLLQNHKALTTLDAIGALSSEVGLSALSDASMKADAARVARVTAARADR